MAWWGFEEGWARVAHEETSIEALEISMDELLPSRCLKAIVSMIHLAPRRYLSSLPEDVSTEVRYWGWECPRPPE